MLATQYCSGLFDLLTQSLFDPGLDDLPEVDQLFSQVPLPEDFELEPVVTMVAGSTEVTGAHYRGNTNPNNTVYQSVGRRSM